MQKIGEKMDENENQSQDKSTAGQFNQTVYNTASGIERESYDGTKTALITFAAALGAFGGLQFFGGLSESEALFASPVIFAIGAHLNRVRFFDLKNKFKIATEGLTVAEKAPLKELGTTIQEKKLDLTLNELSFTKHEVRMYGGILAFILHPMMGISWIVSDYLLDQVTEFRNLQKTAREVREKLPPPPEEKPPQQPEP